MGFALWEFNENNWDNNWYIIYTMPMFNSYVVIERKTTTSVLDISLNAILLHDVDLYLCVCVLN